VLSASGLSTKAFDFEKALGACRGPSSCHGVDRDGVIRR
jgi:hypothetical protein